MYKEVDTLIRDDNTKTKYWEKQFCVSSLKDLDWVKINDWYFEFKIGDKKIIIHKSRPYNLTFYRVIIKKIYDMDGDEEILCEFDRTEARALFDSVSSKIKSKNYNLL